MMRLRIAAFGTAVASAAALMSLPAGQAQAEVITMSVAVEAGPVLDLATFGGVGTANGYVMDSGAILNLNAFLANFGSQYQFTAIGGTSNFPGGNAPFRGQLTLDGALTSTGTGPALTISETEAGFTAPPPYSLTSSSTGFFVNQPSGGGHTASSSFNGASTPTYSVLIRQSSALTLRSIWRHWTTSRQSLPTRCRIPSPSVWRPARPSLSLAMNSALPARLFPSPRPGR